MVRLKVLPQTFVTSADNVTMPFPLFVIVAVLPLGTILTIPLGDAVQLFTTVLHGRVLLLIVNTDEPLHKEVIPVIENDGRVTVITNGLVVKFKQEEEIVDEILFTAEPQTGVNVSVFVVVGIEAGAGLPLYNQPLVAEPKFQVYPVMPGIFPGLLTVSVTGVVVPQAMLLGEAETLGLMTVRVICITAAVPFCNPVPQVLFTGLTLIRLPLPVDKSEVIDALLPAAIQAVPFEIVLPIFQPEGIKYS